MNSALKRSGVHNTSLSVNYWRKVDKLRQRCLSQGTPAFVKFLHTCYQTKCSISLHMFHWNITFFNFTYIYIVHVVKNYVYSERTWTNMDLFQTKSFEPFMGMANECSLRPFNHILFPVHKYIINTLSSLTHITGLWLFKSTVQIYRYMDNVRLFVSHLKPVTWCFFSARIATLSEVVMNRV